jgi:uncharacterized Tic20 family protein
MTFQTSPAVPNTPVAASDKALIILCHLSGFIGVPILLPFIVWLVKRNDPDAVAEHAAETLNFHLSWMLWGICLIPLIFVVVGIPLLIILVIASLILAIIGAIRASDGMLYRYPLTIRLVQ